ncbi:hypothetical protein V2J09_006616 [Rumex salicifolius]
MTPKEVCEGLGLFDLNNGDLPTTTRFGKCTIRKSKPSNEKLSLSAYQKAKKLILTGCSFTLSRIDEIFVWTELGFLPRIRDQKDSKALQFNYEYMCRHWELIDLSGSKCLIPFHLVNLVKKPVSSLKIGSHFLNYKLTTIENYASKTIDGCIKQDVDFQKVNFTSISCFAAPTPVSYPSF